MMRQKLTRVVTVICYVGINVINASLFHTTLQHHFFSLDLAIICYLNLKPPRDIDTNILAFHRRDQSH